MKRNRLEAFSDGVIAILITIMVLELSVSGGSGFGALRHVLPGLLSYVLSFVYLGIYWNNHHHLLHLCKRVTGGILWANLHLLFWLSLIPASTGWLGESRFAAGPAAVYGAILLMSSLAYLLLQRAIVASQENESILKSALGSDWKGKLSVLLYVAGIGASFWSNWVAVGLYVLVTFLWLVPDRRVEVALMEGDVPFGGQ